VSAVIYVSCLAFRLPDYRWQDISIRESKQLFLRFLGRMANVVVRQNPLSVIFSQLIEGDYTQVPTKDGLLTVEGGNDLVLFALEDDLFPTIWKHFFLLKRTPAGIRIQRALLGC
jgi:hypothetical protein